MQQEEQWFSRTELLIGREGLECLAQSHVAVFGLGGVGSYAVEALARAGIGKLTLVDFDRISISNINRQLPALRSTVGKLKTEVTAERLLQINPDLRLELKTEYFDGAAVKDFGFAAYDYLADAIDYVPGKLELIRWALNNGIPVVSCMGAGNKLDPTALRVADISQTSVCPLAKAVRRELRKAGINSGVEVVYSIEPPHKNAAAHIGSISFVPSVAGLYLAATIVNNLLRQAGVKQKGDFHGQFV